MIFIPAVFVGIPDDPTQYEKHQSDGLAVYLPKNGVYSSDTVKIDFALVGYAKRLLVTGLETIPEITCQYQHIPTSKARRLLP